MVKGGEIVEHGSHAELEGKPAGAYATLLKLQLQAQKADLQADLDAGLTDDVEMPASLPPLLLVRLHPLGAPGAFERRTSDSFRRAGTLSGAGASELCALWCLSKLPDWPGLPLSRAARRHDQLV